ncbi:MAG: thymidine phosphorylase, partial [Longimicrobiales bacterium]|nr:thymidine phosphorylase [Longimicrobiales bacterium]
MVPSQLIRRKRDGETLDPAALAELLRAFDEGGVADYQMAAFLMAVHFRGLEATELRVLVETILDSGGRVRFDGGPHVDKHSTGGVGDTVSLVLAPLVASLGVPVPMMSGRGLGHSGGTVDKLESIPGMRLDLSLAEFRDQVDELGLALISQTPEIAPLDGKLYALRDVTATVESVPLIAASIMSKKVAEGIDGLVLDVKAGNGAFLPEEDRALELARTMIGVGEAQGLRVVALLTAMDRPLGRAVGNALEVVEAVETLQGGGPADLREVTLALAAEMLVLGGAASDLASARATAAAALDSGQGLELFRRVVEVQGGDPRALDEPSRLPSAPVRRMAVAERSGRVTAFETRAIGEAAVALGAGRAALGAEIDPRVGLIMQVGPGDVVDEGDPLAEVHAADEAAAEQAARSLVSAVTVGDDEPGFRPLISHRI